ncbi:MAG: DAK2 domain-containing protein [Clostridia bacterium]|nr:DAK2 domain-containing protein [Clostridia bacterium]
MAYDGRHIRRMVRAGHEAIARHIDEVNALNVFPVPDGDSGTNLTLTLEAAVRALGDDEERHAGQVAAKAARGALLGARGNSGVIFSQILRGLAKGLEGLASFEAPDFARALKEASAYAYRAVIEPVEGTILTVVREAAERAEEAAQGGAELVAVLERAVAAAEAAVAKTTELLPVLKEAGVVDSAGKGLHYILDGMCRALAEESLAGVTADRAGRPEAAEARAEGAREPAESSAGAASGRRYGVEVQFMLEGRGLDVEEIRRRIAEMGESVLVVGDETTVKVHVHTLDPDRVVEYAKTLGRPEALTFEDLDAQAEAFREAHARERGSDPAL